MGRIFQWWVGDKELGFPDSEEEVRVDPVLPCGTDWYVAVKMPSLEKKEKKGKELKRKRQRGFLVAPEGALPLQMRQKSGSG